MDLNPYEIPNHLMEGSTASQGRQLAATLRIGRVLRGQVLETFGGNSYLIRVGKHRFSLMADVALQAGQEFLFRVEKGREEGERKLTILSDPGLTEFRLRDALRMVLQQDQPLGDLMISLGESIVSTLGEGGRDQGIASELLDVLEEHLLQPGADGLELADVLNRIGLGYEAGLLRAGALSKDLVDLLELDRDLKAQLLAATDYVEDGPLADSIQRALQGLEAEQVLQVARQVEGDPNHWTFPIRDGDRWVCANLFAQHKIVGPEDPIATPRWRVTLGVEFASIGPVRVDFTLGAGGVTMRMLVTDKGLVPGLQERAKGLQDAIADIVDIGIDKEFLPARVTVFCAPPEDVDVTQRHLDIGFLRHRKVLDLRG